MEAISIETKGNDYLVCLKGALREIENACREFNTGYFLIGLKAVDIWLISLNKQPFRATNDADLTVFMETPEQYKAFADYLIQNNTFKQFGGSHRFIYHKCSALIDILPWNLESTFIIKDKSRTELSNLGLPNARNFTIAFSWDGDFETQIASLPAIVLLKLIAWHEKPEYRRNDIPDIAKVLEKYYVFAEEDILHNHNDLFGGNPDLDIIAARVMGRKMTEIIGNSDNLRTIILGILETALQEKETSRLLQQLILDPDTETIQDKIALVQAVINGLNDNSLQTDY